MVEPGKHNPHTSERMDYVQLADEALLSDCDVNVHRASGPGGQHRNKVSTAVRLYHRPTGVTVQAYESRSQHENKRRALKRLRIKIACRVRRPVDVCGYMPPKVVQSCLFVPRKGPAGGPKRLAVGSRDHRFWPVAQCLLDLLAACEGRLSDAARALGITTSNLASVLNQERELHAAAQAIRKACGLGPLK